MEMSNMRVVTALIPWDIAQKLDQLSELEGRSKAWFIRLALADYLAQYPLKSKNWISSSRRVWTPTRRC